MLKSLATQFIGWLDRMVDADERVVCALCDQRFSGFDDGNVHVRRVHPEHAYGSRPTVSVPAYAGPARTSGVPFAQPAYALRSR